MYNNRRFGTNSLYLILYKNCVTKPIFSIFLQKRNTNKKFCILNKLFFKYFILFTD